MENNYNPYEQNNYDQREPLPSYPYPSQPYNPCPPQPQDVPGLRSIVDSAFAKGLAAAIMAEFPITSIIAIVMGSKANKLVGQAEKLAAQYGTKAGGKKIAAKILGKVGFFAGIGFTIIWAIYILYFIMLFGLIASY